jgi:tetratricopeptide (TPR) repeat protein
MAAEPFQPSAFARPLGGGGGDALQQAKVALGAERPHDAQRIAETILRTNPRHGKALYVLGCALVMQDRAADAIAPLEQAVRELRDAETDTMFAIALRQAGRQDEALARLKRAIKRQPPYAAAFLEFGRLLYSVRRYDEAIHALRRGLEIAPMIPELSIQLGHVSLRCRDYAAAKLAFARALEIAPESCEALFGMARAHQEVGDNKPAADYFRRYLRFRPDDVGMWLNLGHCLLELGQLDAGYECFRTAARGDQKRYGNALMSLASSARGRFWLKPSAAKRFLNGIKS